MTSEDERQALLLSALREVVEKFAAHPDFVADELTAGGVIVVRHPDVGPLQRAFVAVGHRRADTSSSTRGAGASWTKRRPSASR